MIRYCPGHALDNEGAVMMPQWRTPQLPVLAFHGRHTLHPRRSNAASPDYRRLSRRASSDNLPSAHRQFLCSFTDIGLRTGGWGPLLHLLRASAPVLAWKGRLTKLHLPHRPMPLHNWGVWKTRCGGHDRGVRTSRAACTLHPPG